MKWKTFQKKIERIAYQPLFSFGKFKFEVWMLIALLSVAYLAQGPGYSVIGDSFEGPEQEFVAVGFDSQACRYQGATKRLDGVYYYSTDLTYASKWDWDNPSNVHIDPDEAKAGIPDLYFTDKGYGVVDRDFEDDWSENPVDTIAYTLEHDGKEWDVVTYLYYFKTYVTLSAIADDSLNLPGANEVGYNVKADVYCKIGINRWPVNEYKEGGREEMWAGILKITVEEHDYDTDSESRTYYSPSSNGRLALLDSVKGRDLGQYDYDDLSEGWQNPDNIPDRGYYKLSLDFTAGRTITNKLKQPWVQFTIISKVIVTHRWIATDKIGDPGPPGINDDQYEWENWLSIFTDLINGVNILENLVKLLVLIVIGFVALIVIMIILAGLMRIGGKRR